MAELAYFGTWLDSTAILSELFASEDVRVVIDRDYQRPIAECFNFPDAHLFAAARAVSKMYVFGPFSTVGPVFRRQETGPKAGSFYIERNRGGPALELLLSKETETGLLGFGALSYASEYQNPTSGEWEKPSTEIKDAYKRMSKIVRHHVSRRAFPKGTAWVGKDGYDRLMRGELTLSARGLV